MHPRPLWLALLSCGCLSSPDLPFDNPCDPAVTGACIDTAETGVPRDQGLDATSDSGGEADADAEAADQRPPEDRPEPTPDADTSAPPDVDGEADLGPDVSGGACVDGNERPCPNPDFCAGATQPCVGGIWGACLPPSEICDGRDNDCNDEIDEGEPGRGPCDTGLEGACAEGEGVCVDGSIRCDRVVLPSLDVCDGIDQDCDGRVDEGIAQGDARRLTQTIVDSATVEVSAGEDGFGLVWREGVGIDAEIYFAHIGTDGEPTSPLVQVTNADGTSERPSIDYLGEGAFALAWIDLRTGTTDFFYQRQDSAGDPIQVGRQIIAAETSPRRARLAFDGEQLGMTWRSRIDNQNQVRFVRLPIDGDRRDVAETLFVGDNPDIAYNAALEEFLIVFESGALVPETRVFATRITAQGASPRIEISNAVGASFRPRIAPAQDGLAFGVVFEDDSEGNSEIFFARFDVADGAPNPVLRLTNTLSASTSPRIAPHGDGYALAYMDEIDGVREVFLMAIDDEGNVLDGPRPITADPNPQMPTSRLLGEIASTGDVVLVTWEDNRDDPLQSEIYYTVGALNCP